MDALPLEERLERALEEERMLTDIQYENVRDLTTEIVSDSIEQNFVQLNLLKQNYMHRLLKRSRKKHE